MEADGNGSPTNINFLNGVAQKGATNALVTAGQDINFSGIKFKFGNTDGVQVTGFAITGDVTFENCNFAVNNQSGGTAYDINLTHSTGWTNVRNCTLETPVGSGAGNVTNPANDTNDRGYFFGDEFFRNEYNAVQLLLVGHAADRARRPG